MNATAFFFNLLTWTAILIIAFRFYKKQDIKPKIWKTVIVLFIGLFSFSINLPYMNQHVKLAILPVGVWIIYGLYSRKNEGRSWDKYRKFAWLGFFANYLFLVSSLVIPLVHGAIYPKNEISTYLSDFTEARILKSHPSASDKTLHSDLLLDQLDSMTKEPIYSDIWYQETFETGKERAKQDERFPYQLAGTRAKWGSGTDPMIFLEQDGKGVLVKTPKEQFYFRAKEPFLKEGN